MTEELFKITMNNKTLLDEEIVNSMKELGTVIKIFFQSFTNRSINECI